MKKPRSPVKTLLTIFVFLVGVAIIAPLSLLLLLNPNDYKPKIQSYLSEKSGYPIEIQGDIHLQWFPWIGLTAQNIRIPQKDLKQPPLFSAQALHLKMPFKDLIRWTFNLETLTLEQGHFYLVREKNGAVNWMPSYSRQQTKSHPESHQAEKEPIELYFSISLLAIKKRICTVCR